MKDKQNLVYDKSELFAIRIIKLYKYLCNEKKEFVLSKQILRSGTSIVANLSEAECAISKNDWIAKIYIALKECAETGCWLRLLVKTDYISDKEFESMYEDCDEIKRMLTSSAKTAKEQLHHGKK
jgi:four helix bundle protein